MLALNAIPFFPYENGLDFLGLIGFSFFAFLTVSILMWYYNKIPKSQSSKDELENPIYQTKDILLQSNSFDANFIIAEKTTSTSTKLILYVLIAFIVVIPVDQLFSVVNSFY
ncbi:hypothetical protein [uncultured Polaribacter sp.]|uniref:hypothetical protein n=1 Tax=uncultured Polaribacter sp. TaxID=174711 RepID=UPI00261BB111|nr:hypothetical protein [uncultured Polaribacter sp.]